MSDKILNDVRDEMSSMHERILGDLQTEVTPRVQNELDQRQTARDTVQRLETALDEYRGKAEELKREITASVAAVGDAIAQGGDVRKLEKNIRQRRLDLDETIEVALQLETVTLKAAREKLQETEEALKRAVVWATAGVRNGYSAEMTQLVHDGMKIFACWGKAADEFYAELGVKLKGGTMDDTPVIEKPEILDLYIRNCTGR